MKIIGRLIALALIGLASGCDLELYRTAEGIGVIGPAGMVIGHRGRTVHDDR